MIQKYLKRTHSTHIGLIYISLVAQLQKILSYTCILHTFKPSHHVIYSINFWGNNTKHRGALQFSIYSQTDIKQQKIRIECCQTILWYLDEFHSVFICFLSLAPRYISIQLYWANKKIYRLWITSRLNFLLKFYWYSFHFHYMVTLTCVYKQLNKKPESRPYNIT